MGFGVGELAHGSESQLVRAVGGLVDPLGRIWVNALQAAVIPLVISFLITAVTSMGESRHTGRLVGLCLLTFIGLVSLAASYSVPVGYALASGYSLDTENLAALESTLPAAERTDATSGTVPPTFGEALGRLIPANLFRAAVEGEIPGLVLAALVFGLAITRLESRHREVLTRFFKGVAEATMVVVVWILWAMPLGVFGLAFSAAAQVGAEIAWAFGYWVVAASGLLLGFTLLLYPVSVLLGRVRLGAFARALAPAQLVAAGSRSSLAAMPALMEGAEEHLEHPDPIRGFVIPLSSTAFKLSGPLGSPLQLFLLAKLYGVSLDPATVVVFVLGIMLMSFATPGLPSGGFMLRLPWFVAAGIPAEGFLLLTTLDAIPDIFKTVTNVTGDMTVLAIVGRFSRVLPTKTSWVPRSKSGRE
ncbi:MAG: dicarboxylate/amino acid:cation symporter [Gemmatimonadetes bacterium]|nr:dicarboxylate/amino acid:cation symporter [Gemmatimonadota bacterium]NNM05457.1 dicarboxylate/amino acid:cation symporter [Gemmatimonadota bacterium]